jgi:hypothetical protein
MTSWPPFSLNKATTSKEIKYVVKVRSSIVIIIRSNTLPSAIDDHRRPDKITDQTIREALNKIGI